MGFRVVFIPMGVVYHTYGAVKKTFKKYYQQKIVIYYGCRNYITTLIKNLGFVNLAKILPLHILLWFAISVMFIFKREFKKSYWIITAIVWNIINCHQLLKKRNSIQRHIRQVSDAEILENLMVHRKLGYYIGKAIAYIYGRSY